MFTVHRRVHNVLLRAFEQSHCQLTSTEKEESAVRNWLRERYLAHKVLYGCCWIYSQPLDLSSIEKWATSLQMWCFFPLFSL